MNEDKRIDQLGLFPEVTESEKKVVRALLEEYAKIRRGIGALERKEDRTDRELTILRVHTRVVEDIDAAVKLIDDNEVRQVVEDRYFGSCSRKGTIAKFRNLMAESTVDRRIEAGIESVAECLKLWGTKLTVF